MFDSRINQIYSHLLNRSPEDERIKLLRQVLNDNKFDLNKLIELQRKFGNDELLNNKIISQQIDILKQYLSDIPSIRDRQSIINKKQINVAAVNDFWNQCYNFVIEELKTINPVEEVTILSLGCGSGEIETTLDIKIRKEIPSLKIKWIGFDTVDHISDKSIFSKKDNFIKLNSSFCGTYSTLINHRSNNTIIMANYSVHHMVTNPKQFIDQCKGADKIIVLELLMTQNDYNDIVTRIINIGYDLISNIMINPKWADLYLSGESIFEVDYWTVEESEKYFDLWKFPDPHTQRYILTKDLGQK